MNISEILSHCDHTLLAVDATWEQIKGICDDGIKYNTASVCIPASYVKQAKEYVGEKLAICTVIGFPNGYSTSAVKAYEAADAVKNGADEIDMVINLCDVKNGEWDKVAHEIKALKHACGNRVLKVIVETCYLTEAEKVQLCKIVTEAKADYIKTSTGFGSAGATVEDVTLFRKECGAGVKIKAAGGIRTVEDAENMLSAGAERLGSSALLAR